MIYVLFSEQDVGDAPPWSVTNVGDEWSRGGFLTVEEMRPIFADISVLNEQALRDRGADFIEAQRGRELPNPHREHRCCGIGVGVDLTIIDKAGVR